MVYPDQRPGPEHAEAAHPKLKNTHFPENVAVLENRKVAEKLNRGLVIAAVIVAAAITLLYLLL
jgi:hypothetical protein